MVIKHEEGVVKAGKICRARMEGKSVEEIERLLGDAERTVERQKVSCIFSPFS